MGTIKALLAEAGFPADDVEALRKSYGKFEHVIRDMRDHLMGIKEQNDFVLRKGGVA